MKSIGNTSKKLLGLSDIVKLGILGSIVRGRNTTSRLGKVCA